MNLASLHIISSQTAQAAQTSYPGTKKGPSGDTAYRDYRASHQAAGYGDRYAKTYSSGYYAALWSRVEQPLLERILSNLGGADRSCLDFACGTGRITNVAARFFGTVVGVDISESMLDSAAPAANVELVKADLTRQPLARKFDVATAFRFFLNAEDRLRRDALSAIHAHLNENGILVANIHMNASSPAGLASRFLNRWPGGTARNTLSIEGFSRMVTSAGFAVERTIGYGFLPRPGNLLPGICEALVGPVEKLSLRLHLPASLAESFVLVARKR